MSGVYRGSVTRVTADGVFVVIPDLGGAGYEFGPLPSSDVAPPVGAAVLAGTVEGVKDDVVLIGKQGDAASLDDLTDVVITNAVIGDVLQHDGTNWVNQQFLRMKAAAVGTDVVTIAIGAEVNHRLRINGDGMFEWGDGTNPPDVNLYRIGTNELATDDLLRFVRNADTDNAILARVGAEANSRFLLRTDGKMEWGAGGASVRDTNLFRSAPSVLATDDSILLTDGTKQVNIGSSGSTASLAVKRASTADSVLSTRVGADTGSRFIIAADGDLVWGDGGGTTDVILYRRLADQLGTDDAFLITRANPVGDTALGAKASADANFRWIMDASGKMVWGDGTASADTSLFRVGADILGTDDEFRVRRSGSVQSAFSAYTFSSTTEPRLLIWSDGKMEWSDGVAAADVTLARGGSNILTLTDAAYRVSRSTAAGVVDAFSTLVTGEANRMFLMRVDGKMEWGPGGASGRDTNLYRSGASTLKTDDAFNAVLDLQINGVSLLDLVYPVGSLYMSMVNTSPASFIGGTWSALQDRWLVGAGGTYAVDSTGGATTHTHSMADTGSSTVPHTHSISQGTDVTSQVTGPAVFTVSHSTHNHGGATGGASSSSHSHTTPNTDSGSSLPPYRAVYMWKRTA